MLSGTEAKGTHTVLGVLASADPLFLATYNAL